MQGRDGLDRVGAADLIGVGFGQPKMLDLAGLDQFLHRPGHVFHGHVRVRAVLVKQVDGLHAQALERSLGHALDLLGAAVHAHRGTGAFLGVVLEAELGGDDHLALVRFQRFTHQFFVGERPIHFRRVKEGDPVVDRRVQEMDHFLFVGRRVAKAHAHAAQPKGRDF